MVDIKAVRANPNYLVEALRRRHSNVDVAPLLELDRQRRELISETEGLKAKQNETSKQIPALKKEGRDTAAIFAEMKELSDRVKSLDTRLSEIDTEIEDTLLSVPNVPHESVPEGADAGL